jgi:hypothetical protein
MQRHIYNTFPQMNPTAHTLALPIRAKKTRRITIASGGGVGLTETAFQSVRTSSTIPETHSDKILRLPGSRTQIRAGRRISGRLNRRSLRSDSIFVAGS